MTNANNNKDRLLNETPEQGTLREMAGDMQVALYRRYGEAAAAKILGIPVEHLTDLREQGLIGYLDLSNKQVSFFGCQLLRYLFDCIIPPGTETKPANTPAPQSSKPAVAVDAELISVNDAMAQLAIGKTKFYDLMKSEEIACVKIGRRTLIERAEIRRYIDKQIG